MTIQEKIDFLMETIPSEEAIHALRRRYLFGSLEAELLNEASKTLRSSSPDHHLIEWAYDILQLHIGKERQEKEKTQISTQEKMERILALFSNPEDLQAAINSETWSNSDKRAIQLVSHFVANDIPLASNFKIVDKVYRLLENAPIPSTVAIKYFGRNPLAQERERILQTYENYRRKKRDHEREEELPPPIEETGLLKRYTYLLGAVALVVGIFLAGFITARLIYGTHAEALLTQPAMETLVHPRDREAAQEENGTLAPQQALAQQLVTNRMLLQENLVNYGIDKPVEFVTKTLAEAASRALPSGVDAPETTPREKLLEKKGATKPLKGAMRVAVESLGTLQGLRLPLASTENNLSPITPLPEGFRLESDETPATRLVYMTNGEKLYPLEIYAFTAEPTIVQYRLIPYRPGHYMPVVSNIWLFSDIGELRMHKHFVYQNNRIDPVKIVTNLFLPGGESLETVSVRKLDRDRMHRELLVSRKDYLPSAKLLYREDREIDRLAGYWRSRTVRQIWYDEGRKIHVKGLGPEK